MAWVSGEQDASYLSNVATTVGVELDSCSRSGGTVTIKYRAYGRNTHNWSQNSLIIEAEVQNILLRIRIIMVVGQLNHFL